MIAEQFPGWNEETVALIKAGYLSKGMNQDQVRAPCWSCTGTTSGGREVWEYSTQVVFFDKSGKVTHWESR